MNIKLDHESGVPIYLQLIEQVKFLIACGSLKPGDQMPSVRELAVQLKINPNTAARTYRELQYENVIESRRGEGNYISENYSELAKKEKRKIINGKFREVIVQGRSFGLNDDEISKTFIESLDNKGGK